MAESRLRSRMQDATVGAGSRGAREAAAGTAARTAAMEEPESIFALLGLSLPAARAVLIFFILVHAILAFADGGTAGDLVVEIPAFVAVSVAAYALIGHADSRMSLRRALGILGLCVVTMVLMAFEVHVYNPQPFEHWHLGAITLVLLVMALRGRTGWAWVGYFVMAAVTVSWSVLNGLGAAEGFGLVIRHAGTLLVGTLAAVSLHRTARTLAGLNREHNLRATQEATQTAAIGERKAQLDRINALARPALERLANPHVPGEAERADCLLVEAGLRDAMRARSLCLEPLTSSARGARSRGIEVILLDDGGDQPPPGIDALAAFLAAELDAVPCGRFTARLLPAGRADLATVVIESDGHRMLSVLRNGTVLAH
ncbi:hypothetical protein [Leifsonia sp. A12D58]|uniref:hypothetical protein n=1 Tax=Leifsonia sp. A12D58 TaxID=3397674 RepID=UPI0039E1A877